MANKNVQLKSGSYYLYPQTTTSLISDATTGTAEIEAKLLNGSVKYATTEPTSAGEGARLAILNSTPASFKNNWLYVYDPSWELPTQSETTLTVAQAYTSVQSSNLLEVQ